MIHSLTHAQTSFQITDKCMNHVFYKGDTFPNQLVSWLSKLATLITFLIYFHVLQCQ